jgi:hypothetical protein
VRYSGVGEPSRAARCVSLRHTHARVRTWYSTYTACSVLVVHDWWLAHVTPPSSDETISPPSPTASTKSTVTPFTSATLANTERMVT